MAKAEPNDLPPPYSATPPPIGFQSPNPPPTVRVDTQQAQGYRPGQQYPPPYAYNPGKPGPVPVVVATQGQVVTQSVLVIPPGTCPNCRAGFLRNEYSICGMCCAIFFFPMGILCCMLMTERRCSNCHMSFDNI
ncbi:uncharacterized protein [Palaemon carinicauda]|uniref:uncharacterized protein n=1 Tax=Palaemon carinicauda TaxID=392227 RepID=UPI0035B571D3